jgi:hypothetical protein
MSTNGLRYHMPMDPRLEQLKPDTSDKLAETALSELSEAEFEAILDVFSRGSEHLPPLPPHFSRADIYSDHD